MEISARKTTGNQSSTFLDSVAEDIKIAECAKHGPYEEKSMVLFGERSIATICPGCKKDRDDEKNKAEIRAEQARKNERIKHLLGEAGIPKRFIGRRFDNYTAGTVDQSRAHSVSMYFASNFDKFLETGASLMFCGKPGTGKTHLAAAIANSICEQGRAAVFMSVLKATRMIKDTWKKGADASESQVYKGMIDPDLLILDEVGVQFGSDAEKLILFEILNGRYENVKPTIVISNLLPAEITEYLGERVVDRLQEGGGSTVVFGWESYRTKVLGDENLPKVAVSPVKWVA